MLGRVLLRAACLPADALAFFVVLVLAALNGRTPLPDSWRRYGCLVYCPREGSWLARKWHYSTTLGHVILIHPDAFEVGRKVSDCYSETMTHELVHVRQFEVVCLLWSLLAALSPWALMLLPLCWLITYGVASLAAVLGGRSAYLGNVLEHHAEGAE